MDAARVEVLRERQIALAREAKRLILDAVRSGRQQTDAERDDLDRLLREGEAIDAELERAFYAPDPGP